MEADDRAKDGGTRDRREGSDDDGRETTVRDERGVRREVQTGPWNLGSVLSVLSVPGRVLSSTSLHSFLPSLPLTYGSFRNGVTEGGRERSEWTTDDTTEGTSRRWGRV